MRQAKINYSCTIGYNIDGRGLRETMQSKRFVKLLSLVPIKNVVTRTKIKKKMICFVAKKCWYE